MMKGIRFNDIHSYDDLNLMLSKVNIPPAAVKTKLIDIPGGDGSADLTEALGEVKYKDRECTFTFTVFPQDDFEEKKREVNNLLNGRQCTIVVDKDPNYHWTGRCKVNEYASDKNVHKIVVGATVAPYKVKTSPTIIVAPSGENITIDLWNNGKKTVVPTITNTADVNIVFNGNHYNVNAGTHKILDIRLTTGANSLVVTSNESVMFSYQEGDL